MWGGKNFKPGKHIGNVKIGPAGTRCPEDAKVMSNFVKLNVFLCYICNNKFSDLLFYEDRGLQITEQYKEN